MAYWQDRFAASQSIKTKKTIKQIKKQLSKYYAITAKQVIDDFENTYLKLLETVEKGKQPTPADLYKLDKYWQLQGQLREQLRSLGEKEVVLLTKYFELNFFDVYYAIEIDGAAAFNTLDKETVSQMINHIWCADGKSWSQRIWEDTDALAATLNEQLINTVAAGRKTTELKHLLQDRFGVSYSRADALVRTETAHIQTQAAQKRYEDYGLKEVEVWVDEDERTCPVCSQLEGKRIPIHGVMPVPAHPRCRCCIIPVVE